MAKVLLRLNWNMGCQSSAIVAVSRTQALQQGFTLCFQSRALFLAGGQRCHHGIQLLLAALQLASDARQLFLCQASLLLLVLQRACEQLTKTTRIMIKASESEDSKPFYQQPSPLIIPFGFATHAAAPSFALADLPVASFAPPGWPLARQSCCLLWTAVRVLL